MSKIKRYNYSRKEGMGLFFKTVAITFLCIMSLVAGFLAAAYFSGFSGL